VSTYDIGFFSHRNDGGRKRSFSVSAGRTNCDYSIPSNEKVELEKKKKKKKPDGRNPSNA